MWKPKIPYFQSQCDHHKIPLSFCCKNRNEKCEGITNESGKTSFTHCLTTRKVNIIKVTHSKSFSNMHIFLSLFFCLYVFLNV